VKKIIDNAPYTAKQAQEQGLIDGALYREDVEKMIKKNLGTTTTMSCASSRHPTIERSRRSLSA
jgi:hypothetical protein